ncbi:MAG: YadA-like family protein, partial [Phascolarctobacterium sp.]|nr:YadA-like family protein [Phascolarctobacterium sp.]
AINGSQLWETNRNMDKLGGRLDKVGAGAAALAALHPLDFDPDDKLQFSAGVGNYKGETAAAIGAFYRPTEKVMFSVAGTMGNGENMVNAGVTFALDRKNNVSNSRVAMAHEIKDLRDQVAALTALVSQIAGKGNPLLDTVMFPDVPENHWAYDYVENLQKRGIIEGYPDGNFGGDRSMTRYEYAAMLYRALEKGFPVDGRLLKEFEAELGRIRIDRIKGADDDANKVERVRVNDYEDRDDYGSKLAQVVADAAPVVEEEPAA